MRRARRCSVAAIHGEAMVSIPLLETIANMPRKRSLFRISAVYALRGPLHGIKWLPIEIVVEWASMHLRTLGGYRRPPPHPLGFEFGTVVGFPAVTRTKAHPSVQSYLSACLIKEEILPRGNRRENVLHPQGVAAARRNQATDQKDHPRPASPTRAEPNLETVRCYTFAVFRQRAVRTLYLTLAVSDIVSNPKFILSNFYDVVFPTNVQFFRFVNKSFSVLAFYFRTS